jgi:predicted Zn-dependent peptidase
MQPTLKTLKNGMPVIMVPQKGVASMTILVLTRVGSRYETAEVNGASHFIEHLMFKGTKRRPTAAHISRELDRYGAAYNAYTDKDHTGYYIKMDAAHTELAVDMLHDMLFASKFNAADIDRERGVIVEEINMYEDNPQAHVEDMLDEALFPGSTLGWNIAGPREVIRRISPKDLTDYRDAYYIPERMVIAVAGALPANMMTLLNKTFGTVKRKAEVDAPFVPFKPPTKLSDAVAYQDKKTEQVQLALGFYGFPLGDSHLAAATLLSVILGGTMSSRLFTEIRERRGLCYSIHASHQAREDVGEFTVLAGLDKVRTQDAIVAIVAELKKIAKNPVTAEELRCVKDHIRGRIFLAFEDSAT